ncbi:uncharacterized protein LOC131633505 [Vicia villosa]|uniref:uncharacterized protein LOC131633505 n=1 Tax=Vicia villosa TaxID=3911 RepID=UPI00273CC604|nr:uncharacterized protein LOC131633505 [Vicia villosa]
MDRMQLDPNFNHHPKCEKVKLTNLTFADFISLFCRGDAIAAQLMFQTMRKFSTSTGMGYSEACSGFQEGDYPFRYLGVPLTTKKLSISHYLPLIDKIVTRIHHWSAKLLSYVGKLQLLKIISHAMAQFWMQCFPIPKMVIKKIDAICRSFIWTDSKEISRKCPVAWNTMCKPIAPGGLHLLNDCVE